MSIYNIAGIGLRMQANPQSDEHATKSKSKYIIVATVILVLAMAVGIAYALTWLNTIPSNENNFDSTQTESSSINTSQTSASWMTKGTYANYEGQAQIMSIDISFNAKMEITNLNDTHAEITTTYYVSTPYGSEQNSTSFWVSKTDATFEPQDFALDDTYHTQLSVPDLGMRDCTVYEYKNDGLAVTYYVDDTLGWPLKLVMTSPVVDGQSYNMDLNLTETNIEGLH
jgi:hypothetical protein